MGIGTGLTPETGRQTGVDVCRPSRSMERETGIEPVSLAWKAKVLPLNYSRPGSQNALHSTSKSWWRRLDSNQRTLCGQIYSLLPLTTRPPLLRQARNYSTEQRGRNRGLDKKNKRDWSTRRRGVRAEHPKADCHVRRQAPEHRPEHPNKATDFGSHPSRTGHQAGPATARRKPRVADAQQPISLNQYQNNTNKRPATASLPEESPRETRETRPTLGKLPIRNW